MADIVDPFATPTQPSSIVDPFAASAQPSSIVDPFASSEAPVQRQEDVAEYEGFFQEMGEGFASGIVGIGQGIGELVGSGIDLAFDTDVSSKVTSGAEAIRNTMGWDPAGIAGKGVEILTQFAIPGLGAASMVAKAGNAARLAKGLYAGKEAIPMSAKLAQGAKQLAAFGAVDAAVATDGMTTISDFFDGGSSLTGMGDTLGVLESNQTAGLQGRDEAKRRLANKLKLGLEGFGVGAIASAAIPVAKAVGATKVVQKVGTPVVKGAAAVTRPVVNVAGAGLKAAADFSAPYASAGIRRAGETKVGQAIGDQASNLGQYSRDLDEARVFGPTEGGVLNRNATYGKLGELSLPDSLPYVGGRQVSEGLNTARNYIDATLGGAAELLRPRGILPTDVDTARLLSKDAAMPDIKRAETFVKKFDKKLDMLADKFGKVANGTTPLHRDEIYTKMEQYMTATAKSDLSTVKKAEDLILKDLPKVLHEDLIAGKATLNKLRESVVKSKTFEQLPQATQEIIKQNIPSYLRRRMRIFEDINYKPTQEVYDTALNGFKYNNGLVSKELTLKYKAKPSEFSDARLADLGLEKVGFGKDARVKVVTRNDEAAKLAVDSLLARHRPKSRGVFGYKNITGGRVAEQQINSGMFMERTDPPIFYRALLGEIDDPREKIVATIADLAEFRAIDDYLGDVTKLADNNAGIGRFFVAPERIADDVAVQEGLKNGTYVQLGGSGGTSRLVDDPKAGEAFDVSAWGPLYGYAVPKRVYMDLTQKVIGSGGNEFVDGMRATYSSFLRAKGASQYTKTVLSPITQLRNVSTASMFALAQGNVGKEASLGESVSIVMKGISDAPSAQVLDELEGMQRRGVVGTNAQLKELQDSIGKGLGYAGGDTAAQQQSQSFAKRLQQGQLTSFLGGTLGKAQDFYQGGDDIWKIYNFKFEEQKYLNALRNADVEDQIDELVRGKSLTMTREQLSKSVADDPMVLDGLLKDRAAQIVRDTVPNYNKVPEAIKALRRTPYGNFTAFPYEIMRTGSNTIAIGLDELMSANAEIQKIGMRRLMGASIAFGGAGKAVSEIGYALSGVSEEEMDAYRRSFGTPWEKNARLVPVGRDEKGMPIYVNFSYSNPYGMLDSIATSALNQVDEGRRLGKGAVEIVNDATNEVLVETFRPFMDESILYSKLKDAADPKAEGFLGKAFNIATLGGRGGDPVMGSNVYRDEDTTSTKAANSLMHIFDAFLPGAAPFQIKSGEIESGRFFRGLLGGEDSPIPGKDRGLRDYKGSTEILRAMTGVTPLNIDAEKALYYRGIEFKNRIQDSKNMFNSVARRGNVTSGELISAYKESNEARYRISNEMHQVIEDMKTLGLSKREISKILKDNNISGVDGILSNKFDPLYPSDSILDVMSDNGTYEQYPKQQILDLYRQARNTPFAVDKPVKKTPAPASTGIVDPFAVPKPAAPAPASTGIVDPFASLAPSAIPTSSFPSLAGGDPNTQEIARRLNLG